MRVPMKYGDGELLLELPTELLGEHHALPSSSLAVGSRSTTGLDELAAAGLSARARGRTVALLVNDGTRDPVHEAFLPGLLELVKGARELRVFVCTGTHAPELPATREVARGLEAALRAAGRTAEIVVHDARATAPLGRGAHLRSGVTARGTPIELHARAAECELFVAVSDMKHHYFAGYSNPVKSFVPGIASLETARANHSLALESDATFGRHPWHPDPARRSNPLAEDMVEGLGLFLAGRPALALALVMGAGGAAWSGGGELAEVAGRGMLEVDRRAGVALEPARYVVVSPGGRPHDESLYTAQRALELSRAAVRPGGEVLFLAECANGIGPRSARENFFEPLARPLDEILAGAALARRDAYVMYAHKPVKFARYLRELGTVHMLSTLPADEVRRIHLEPTADAGAVLARWGREARPGDRVHFLDDASRFAVRPTGAGPRSAQVPMP